MQRLMEQVARRLVYIVLTAAIAVPVWLATRPHLGVVSHDAAPLDIPASVGSAGGGTTDATDPKPLVASIAPLSADPTATAGLSLQLTGDSWVRITAPGGRIVEQSLLHAGEERDFPVGSVGQIVIGNAAAARLLRNGQAVDLTSYARSNVARFAVSSDGSLVPVAD